MQQQNFTPLYPPLQVRAGVLVVDGFGIALRVVNRGKLRVEDGIGRQRRSIVLDRAGSGLERLVLIGKEGHVTLEALAWLRAIGAALVQIGRDGEVLAHSMPYGYDGHPIRRAQALAVTNGLGLAIARDLIASKLDGQRRNLAQLRAPDLREFDGMRAALGSAEWIERIGRSRPRPRAYISGRGRTWKYDSASATSHVSRRGGFVVARARRCSREPLARQRRRSTLCGTTFLLVWSRKRASHCSRMGSIQRWACCTRISATAIRLHSMPWSRCARTWMLSCSISWKIENSPLATSASFRTVYAGSRPADARTRTYTAALARIASADRGKARAGVSRGARRQECIRPRPSANGGNARSVIPASKHSPLEATPRKAPQPRPYAAKAWGTPRLEARPSTPITCASCGEPVLKRRRRHCDACIPQARREHGLRAIEAARKALAAQAAAGTDPRASARPGASAARRMPSIIAAIIAGRASIRDSVTRPGSSARSRRSSTLSRSRRSGRRRACRSRAARASGPAARVPHARHWAALRELVDS